VPQTCRKRVSANVVEAFGEVDIERGEQVPAQSAIEMERSEL
jgi:hypothetical protein